MADKKQEKEEKTVVVAKNAAELQKIRLEKLMNNPTKPVHIAEKSKDYKQREPLEFIRNIWGSSAGAGSGDFHVYRGVRRREYARQKFRKEKEEKEDADDAYHSKVENNQKEADEKTAKKRAKRLKKKQKQKNKKPKREEKEPSDDDEEEDEEDNEGKEATTDTGNAERNSRPGVDVNNPAEGEKDKTKTGEDCEEKHPVNGRNSDVEEDERRESESDDDR